MKAKAARSKKKPSLSFLDRFKAHCHVHGHTQIDGVALAHWTGPIPPYVKDAFCKTEKPDSQQMQLWVNACENHAVSVRAALHR